VGSTLHAVYLHAQASLDENRPLSYPEKRCCRAVAHGDAGISASRKAVLGVHVSNAQGLGLITPTLHHQSFF